MSAVYETVVVGSDGSKPACRAVGRAAALAAGVGAGLVVATAYTRPEEADVGPASERAKMPTDAWRSSGYRGASETAADAAGFAKQVAPGVQVESAAVEGEPAEALITCAASKPSALLAVGNLGMSGSERFLLGNVPNKVSHHADTDVLIVNTGERREIAAPRRLLLCTDGSKTANRALRTGLGIAASLGVPPTVLTAGPQRRSQTVLDEAARMAADVGVEIAAEARTGAAADEIVDAAADHDLVVVGNRGMTGAGRFLLGSVPNKVSHHVSTDLLIVKTV